MAIELADLYEILNVLKDQPKKSCKRLLILGSAEIHIDIKTYRDVLIKRGINTDLNDEKITPFLLGQSLGFQLTETLDINGKASITHDLMGATPQNLLQRYDMIIDAGVLFWCFNPGTALQNILDMLKTDGDVVHITAVSGFYGRGYYNIHPKLLDDFYSANHCKFLSSSFRSKLFPLSIWQRILNRISKSMQFHNNRNMFQGRLNTIGNVYLKQDAKYSYSFTGDSTFQDIKFIPNDIIGVLAYRKLQNTPTVNPILL